FARRQAQREQPAAARFFNLDLLQEGDEGPCRFQPLNVLPGLLGNQVQVHSQAKHPPAPRRLLPRRTRARGLSSRCDKAVVAVVHAQLSPALGWPCAGLAMRWACYRLAMPASCASSPAWVRLSRPSLSSIRDT